MRCPTPILVFCARSDALGLKRSFEALDAGALEVVEKPHPKLGLGPRAAGASGC